MLRHMPKLKALPKSLPLEHAICIELQEGVPIFKASSGIQSRIEELLLKQKKLKLTRKENHELSVYEELDDYLSFANRIIRNIVFDNRTLTRAA
ncbi:MAG: hypothetical protein ACREOI_02525 [bacterium]